MYLQSKTFPVIKADPLISLVGIRNGSIFVKNDHRPRLYKVTHLKQGRTSRNFTCHMYILYFSL